MYCHTTTTTRSGAQGTPPPDGRRSVPGRTSVADLGESASSGRQGTHLAPHRHLSLAGPRVLPGTELYALGKERHTDEYESIASVLSWLVLRARIVQPECMSCVHGMHPCCGVQLPFLRCQVMSTNEPSLMRSRNNPRKNRMCCGSNLVKSTLRSNPSPRCPANQPTDRRRPKWIDPPTQTPTTNQPIVSQQNER